MPEKTGKRLVDVELPRIPGFQFKASQSAILAGTGFDGKHERHIGANPNAGILWKPAKSTTAHSQTRRKPPDDSFKFNLESLGQMGQQREFFN